MNMLLAAAVGFAQEHLLTAGLVFFRIATVIALLPAFGERVVPGRIRLAVTLAITAVVAPAVADRLGVPPEGLLQMAGFLLVETANGLILGFVLRLAVQIVEMAGGLAAQAGSLSQMFGVGGDPLPAMSHLLVMAALCLAVLSGLHVRAAEALILSYDALPAGEVPGAAILRDWSVAHVARAFALSFSLAAPFVAAALLYNVALGVINRAMPSLMVAFVGAPALTAGALMLLALTAPLMLAVWKGAFASLLADPFAVPR